jgi:ELWxxDGT repeat protein
MPYLDWRTNQTAIQSTFVPDAGTGKYSFRARYRIVSSGAASRYSPAASIMVTSLSALAIEATTTELWKSDGTEPGTVLGRDTLRRLGEARLPAALTDVTGTLLFSANSATKGRELGKSDGMPSGTVLVRDIQPGTAGSSPPPWPT